jgi:peptide/nickel transport system permease protein
VTGRRWPRALRDPRIWIGGGLLAAFAIAAAAAPLIVPYDPIATDFSSNLVAPTRAHLLGTDRLGRDILSRIIDGSRYSLGIATMTVGVGAGLGTLVGVTSAYFAGRVDLAVMRVVDGFLAFPTILLALIVVATFGSGFWTLVAALATATLPSYARIMRGAALGVRTNQYIEAARALGGTDVRVIARHLLPNVVAPLLVTSSFAFGTVLLAEASLAFLGLGVPKPAPTWGSMVSEGRAYLSTEPWVALYPGLVIMLSVLAVNLVGDALRDAADPTLRNRS